jgi:RHH-type transcriptional regulator, proline utilization regulon repressor / proline dehydrogenase / delta 1-pyrroline-5-carboxylate dehydrogenase
MPDEAAKLAAAVAFDPGLEELDALKHQDEEARVAALLASPALDAAAQAAVSARAQDIILKARAAKRRTGVIETFLEEYGLSSPEGLALMCLAEALLRVPDAETADALIAEAIATGDWKRHFGHSDSFLVNAGTWGLMLTGRIVSPSPEASSDPPGFIARLVREAGEPVIRAAMMQAMRIMASQFVMGRTIEEALQRGELQVRRGEAAGFSFDMLGEGARTYADAQRHFEAYARAIGAVGQAATGPTPESASGVSVKLSALHPAYRAVQGARVHAELYPALKALALKAAAANIHMTLDAEEADRLVLSLELLERLAAEPELGSWTGLGLALQAYQKRAEATAGWIAALARRTGRRLMVRLVKGAYWDSEIKRGQVEGHTDYPVFTTKAATDASYLACARALSAAGPAIYLQFATHNAHTLAAVEAITAQARRGDFEFQRLHGMGTALYAAANRERQVRVYAPVGAHRDLLPYLVRRLLENGANTSFVHAFLDEDAPAERLAADPYAQLAAAPRRHPRIPPPPALYGASRRNSAGVDLSQDATRARLRAALDQLAADGPIRARPIVSGVHAAGIDEVAVVSPADLSHRIGSVAAAGAGEVELAFDAASAFQAEWDARGGEARGALLRAMADALEQEADRFVALLAREGGRTLDDGVSEVREAVDFCRYYAAEAEAKFAAPGALPGPAGETNALELMGRGVFVCISPWNFPLAIFTGQIAAALAAGNTVIAKPAEQTPLIAFEAVRLFHKAGLPADALHLLPGDGRVGAKLVEHAQCAGVAFTGSTEVGRIINRTLAAKDGPIAPLIAETGGLNAMFVDTTALTEQVVDDVLASAFRSAGQRCSALRILLLPHETADATLEMLKGAMAAMTIGDPADPATDVGPVIDRDARQALQAHLDANRDRIAFQADAGKLAGTGRFLAPAIVELGSLDEIDREIFGPILHVVRYDPDRVEETGGQLAAKGYGLTLGIHSRLGSFVARVKRSVKAGNVYINRSIIGAVVGVQPFGGMGLSGTGPKAGGPHYVTRFATERTVTENIAAQGGDPALLNL